MTPKPRKNLKSIRLNETDQQKYAELYGTVYAGASQAAEVYLTLRDYTLMELKGKFDGAELMALIMILERPYLFQSKQNCSASLFATNLKDELVFERIMSTTFVANYPAFTQKVRALTSAQVYFLEDEIYRYWNSEQRNLEEFIAKFL